MRAAILEKVDSPLVVVDDVDCEGPRAGEITVRISHCGLCHSDLHYLDGHLSGELPMLLGHEASGYIEAVGAEVTGLAVGDAVSMTMRPACRACYW